MRRYGDTLSPCGISEDELCYAHGRSTQVVYGGWGGRFATAVRPAEYPEKIRKIALFSRLRFKRKAADKEGQ